MEEREGGEEVVRGRRMEGEEEGRVGRKQWEGED